AIGVHFFPPSKVSSTDFLEQAASPWFSSKNQTRRQGDGGLESLCQSRPPSVVCQIPFSVTIQPRLSLRQNRESGCSSKGACVHWGPPWVVVRDPGFWLLPS